MKILLISLISLLLVSQLLGQGPYAPAANQEGTTAVANDDPDIIGWATSVISYRPGEDVDEMWQDTSFALTPATTNAALITSLGRGGEIVLGFDPPIKNGSGPDFAIFENSFSHTFLELAFVEVSADGETYQRFASASETASAVGPFGFLDATKVDGLAGKYIGGFGTPFDLADLAIPLAEIRFIRLLDVTGGTSLDSEDRVIFDPFPTQGSSGFDLAGVAVLSAPIPVPIPSPEITSIRVLAGELALRWRSRVGESYLVESSPNLLPPWQVLLQTVAQSTETSALLPLDSTKRFYRVSLQQEE